MKNINTKDLYDENTPIETKLDIFRLKFSEQFEILPFSEENFKRIYDEFDNYRLNYLYRCWYVSDGEEAHWDEIYNKPFNSETIKQQFPGLPDDGVEAVYILFEDAHDNIHDYNKTESCLEILKKYISNKPLFVLCPDCWETMTWVYEDGWEDYLEDSLPDHLEEVLKKLPKAE